MLYNALCGLKDRKVDMLSTWILLIDHDNIPLQEVGLATLITQWLKYSPSDSQESGIQELLVRSYGGWWREDRQSTSRFSAGPRYADLCPALMRVNGCYWRVRFEFADHLLAFDGEQSPAITHTFALRPAPQLCLATEGKGCEEQDCEARKLRKWVMRRRGCTRKACPRAFGDIWQKPEQKQVDIHIAADLLHLSLLAGSRRYVALVSDDIDFIPAILAFTKNIGERRSLTWIRCNRDSSYLDEELNNRGITIMKVNQQYEARNGAS
jgi:hypothetical protein